MKMIFYTPVCGRADGFGAASFGFAGAEDETALNKVVCPFDIEGMVVSGKYTECLKNIPDGKWQAGIVLLGNAGNENEFIKALAEKTGTPLVGGAAAINPITGEKGIVTSQIHFAKQAFEKLLNGGMENESE